METVSGSKLICNTAYFAAHKSAETQKSPGELVPEELGSIPRYGTNKSIHSTIPTQGL